MRDEPMARADWSAQRRTLVRGEALKQVYRARQREQTPGAEAVLEDMRIEEMGEMLQLLFALGWKRWPSLDIERRVLDSLRAIVAMRYDADRQRFAARTSGKAIARERRARQQAPNNAQTAERAAQSTKSAPNASPF